MRSFFVISISSSPGISKSSKFISYSFEHISKPFPAWKKINTILTIKLTDFSFKSLQKIGSSSHIAILSFNSLPSFPSYHKCPITATSPHFALEKLSLLFSIYYDYRGLSPTVVVKNPLQWQNLFGVSFLLV